MSKNELDTLTVQKLIKMTGTAVDQVVFTTDQHRELYLNFVYVRNTGTANSVAQVGLDRGAYLHLLGRETLTVSDVWYKMDIKQWLRAGEKIRLAISAGAANDKIRIHITGHYR